MPKPAALSPPGEGETPGGPRPRARRAYGTGSLFERNGRWIGQWRPKKGTQIRRTIGPVRRPARPDGLTRVQAEARLRTLIHETTPARSPWRITIHQAGEAHLASVRLRGRKRTTLDSYESHLRIHLVPAFGEQPIARITEDEIDQLVHSMLDSGLSAKTVRNLLAHLNAIFNFAKRKGWVSRNPVELVDKPADEARDTGIRFLTQDELNILLAATMEPVRRPEQALADARPELLRPADRRRAPVGQDDSLYRLERVLYLVAAMTGLRQRELVAHQWQDIDFAAGRVRVNRNFVRGEFTSPKSGKGRSVPLADAAAHALRAHKLSSAWSAPGDLVFGRPENGLPLDRSRTTQRFRAAVTRAGVGRFATVVDAERGRVQKPLTRFHDLRHTFGTTMAASGVPIRSIQAWMGHASIQTTMIYADYAPSEHETDLVNAAYGRISTDSWR